MALDAWLAALALGIALALRPWRLLAGGGAALATPMLGTLAVLPWLWALPWLQAAPMQLRWSGAVLVLLMLGWPLAVPVLVAAGALAAIVSTMPWHAALHVAVWQGIAPATFAMLVGAALRRWLPPNIFIYIIGRGFLGAVLSLFAALALEQWLGPPTPGVEPSLGLVARWLMAWGDAVVTGMLCAIFVAYKPAWLLTWSDTRYLGRAADE
jgi:uncharacterized membrane protein